MRTLLFCLLATMLIGTTSEFARGQEANDNTPATTSTAGDDAVEETGENETDPAAAVPESEQFREAKPLPPLPEPAGLKRLAKDYRIWADLKRKLVIVDGYISLQRGQLEMFACPKKTKEHESVVAIDCPARFVHAGLLLIGAKAGTPVQFTPGYAPAMGDVIEVMVLWKDKDGKGHKVRAQQWIRDTTTEKEMAYNWVFGGSGFWVDKETGQQHYYADDGDFICVSNFSTATLDLPVKSTQLSDGLLFECYPDRIPPRKTPVRLVLRVNNPPKEDAGKNEDAGENKEAAKQEDATSTQGKPPTSEKETTATDESK